MGIKRIISETLNPALKWERLAREGSDDAIGGQGSVPVQPTKAGPAGPGEVKSISGGDLVPLQWSGRPLWSDWDTTRALEEGFGASLWVYVSIDKIARSVASLPWLAQREVSGEAERWLPDADSPLQALLERPNEHMGGSEFMYRLVASLLISGNGVISKVRGLRDIVAELWVVGPAGLSVIPDSVDFIRGYQYEVMGKKTFLDAKDVIHIQKPSPANPWWGMSPMKAGAKSIDTEREAADWQKLSLQNRAIPDGILSFRQNINQKQYEEARQRVREQYSGPRNARQIMILGSDAQYNALSMSAQEMDFIDSRKMSREEILALFGVPPPVVGLYENATLNNVRTAREIFWSDTVLPLASSIADGLNTALAPEFGDGRRVMYDTTNVEALWEVFERKLESAQKLQRMGVSFSEINQRLQLGFADRPHHHVAYIGSDMIPAGAMMVDTFGDEE